MSCVLTLTRGTSRLPLMGFLWKAFLPDRLSPVPQGGGGRGCWWAGDDWQQSGDKDTENEKRAERLHEGDSEERRQSNGYIAFP